MPFSDLSGDWVYPIGDSVFGLNYSSEELWNMEQAEHECDLCGNPDCACSWDYDCGCCDEKDAPLCLL